MSWVGGRCLQTKKNTLIIRNTLLDLIQKYQNQWNRCSWVIEISCWLHTGWTGIIGLSLKFATLFATVLPLLKSASITVSTLFEHSVNSESSKLCFYTEMYIEVLQKVLLSFCFQFPLIALTIGPKGVSSLGGWSVPGTGSPGKHVWIQRAPGWCSWSWFSFKYFCKKQGVGFENHLESLWTWDNLWCYDSVKRMDPWCDGT